MFSIGSCVGYSKHEENCSLPETSKVRWTGSRKESGNKLKELKHYTVVQNVMQTHELICKCELGLEYNLKQVI